MTAHGWAIETVGLTKRFGPVLALDGLDLTVAPGETFGFLGPNGAGKSTTIRLLLNLIRPTAGSARVHGVPATDVRRAHRRRPTRGRGSAGRARRRTASGTASSVPGHFRLHCANPSCQPTR